MLDSEEFCTFPSYIASHDRSCGKYTHHMPIWWCRFWRFSSGIVFLRLLVYGLSFFAVFICCRNYRIPNFPVLVWWISINAWVSAYYYESLISGTLAKSWNMKNNPQNPFLKANEGAVLYNDKVFFFCSSHSNTK